MGLVGVPVKTNIQKCLNPINRMKQLHKNILSTKDLKDGEVPIIAHEGEVVLNPNQQEQLLDNVDTPPSSDIEAVFDKLGLKKLDPGEHPMILHNKGEVIFPEEQQKVFMDKLSEMNNFRPNINVPDYSSLVTKQSQPVNINVSYGDLSFPNVRNVDDAINEFAKQTEAVIVQNRSKYIDGVRR